MSRSLRLALAAAVVCGLVPMSPSTRLAAQAAAQGDATQVVPATAYQGLRWRNVGAARGGRVTGLAGVRQQPHTFYIGASGGGVWKTEDAGITWNPIGDGQFTTGSIGSIEVAPSSPNHVWVGTGSAPIRSNVIIGRGVFKSTDAGANFQFMGLKDVGQIGGIRIHPNNPDIVWLAASGSPFGPGADRGVYKTTDGGTTWKKTLFVDNEHGARDIEVDWQNPSVLYVGMYRGFRKGWDIISGGPADKGGIYKSTDGGDSWKKISAGLPAKLIGKIDLDIARSNPRVLYAMIEAPGAEGGLYRSSDAGESWANVNSSQRLRARPFYFNYVHVNPVNENDVWVNELGVHKSSDGGKTFTSMETPHGDNHGMWFNPDNPDIILQVNDGGGNVSLNGGKSWSSILNQPHAEYYMVGVDEQHPYKLYVPQQDNSTLIIPSNPSVSWGLDHPAEMWVQASGCETGQIWPRKDGSVIWGACKGEVGRYSVATGQETHFWIYPQNRYGHDPDEIKYRFPRQTVVYLSPHDDKIVYQASHVLHRSVDEGVTWATISPDLTAREPEYQIIPGTPITRDITGEEVYSSIYAMIESRLEKGVIVVGANDGPVSITRDNGKTWKRVTPKTLAPGGRIQTVEDSPHKKGTFYVAAYRFMREHDLKPYIYKTTDYGESWTLLTSGTNGIPADHPTRVVREDPKRQGLLYAGTEFGAFVSFNDGVSWQGLQQNLPATPVTDIKVHRNDVVISTMGRGLWIMDDVAPLQQLANIYAPLVPMTTSAGTKSRATAVSAITAVPATLPAALPAAYLFQPQDAMRYRYTPTPPSGSEPEYSVPGAHFDLYFAGAPADATLEVKDAKGATIRTFAVAPARPAGAGQDMRNSFQRIGGSTAVQARAGMQRFTWDMRYPGPWAVNAPNGGAGGPLAAPGKYSVSLTAAGQTQTRAFSLVVDPRVTRDGVTQLDLDGQVAFQIKVRDAISETRKLAESVNQAMQKASVRPPAAAPVGKRPMDMTFDHPLQKVWATLNDMPGAYPQPMLLNQFNTVQRMIGQGDQRIGKDAVDRYTDLMKDLAAVQAEFKRIP